MVSDEVGVVGKAWFGWSSIVAHGVMGANANEQMDRPMNRVADGMHPNRQMSLAFRVPLPFLELFRPAASRVGGSHRRM